MPNPISSCAFSAPAPERIAAALLLLALASPAATPAWGAGSEIHFQGEFLLAVEGTELAPPEEMRSAAETTSWRVEPLMDLPLPGEPAGGPAGEDLTQPAARTRRWLRLTSTPQLATAVRRQRHPWDQAHELVTGAAGALLAPLLQPLEEGAEAPLPVALEPHLSHQFRPLAKAAQGREEERCRQDCTSRAPGSEVAVCCSPSRHWPHPGHLAWHLEDDYSQLAAARLQVAGEFAAGPTRVRIAHLDTGYDDRHVTLPASFDREASLNFVAAGGPLPGGVDPFEPGFGRQPGHGTGTLGLLAGNRIQTEEPDGSGRFDDFLGGAPLAEVFEYRISNSVVHLSPVQMALAIRHATDQRADLISLSMGGLPSGLLRDAVNDAYDRGTAVFAACGNFLKLPLLPLSSPSSLVYPARFDRVVAVCGVTAGQRTYARAPKALSWLRGNVRSWAMRGNFGPPAAMEEAIAAYTPNSPWARHGRGEATHQLDLDGAGTSSATPQLAATAALWLQKNRRDLEPEWRGWRKVEAVYRALFDSADKTTPDREHSRKYFGQGILKAKRALATPPPPDLAPRKRARIGLGWLQLLTSIGPFEESQAARTGLRNEMLRTEIAQLVYGSVRLQRLLGDRALDEEIADPRRLRRFLRRVAREDNASETLRRAIADFLAHGGGG